MANSLISSIEVPFFEEYLDDSSSIVTQYVINVSLGNPVHSSYHIRKRYSEFAELQSKLKELSPKIENFKFPHKSMFNTHSQFTKERRRQGFDEFLKLVLTLTPFPKQAEIFLELNEHMKPNISTRQSSPNRQARDPSPLPSNNSSVGNTEITDNGNFNNNNNNNNNDCINEKASSKITENDSRNTFSSSRAPTNVSSSLSLVPISEAKLEKKKIFFGFLPRCSLGVLVVYLFFVYWRVIDISTTPTSKRS